MKCVLCLESHGTPRKKCMFCTMCMHDECYEQWKKYDKSGQCPLCRRALYYGGRMTRTRMRALSDKEFVQLVRKLFEEGYKTREDVLGLVLVRDPSSFQYDTKVAFYEFLVGHYTLYAYLKENGGHVLDWVIM